MKKYYNPLTGKEIKNGLDLKDTEVATVLEYSVTEVNGKKKCLLVLSKSKSERLEVDTFEEVIRNVGKIGRKVILLNGEILAYVKNIKEIISEKKPLDTTQAEKPKSYSRGTGCAHHPKNS